MHRAIVFLVPGFFGFSSLGGLNYFQNVRRVLGAKLRERGLNVEVIDCTTKPTASICRRSEWLLQEIIGKGALEADELHFVGHSTGGLDLRLLLTPGVRLQTDDAELEVSEKARTCITLATPHFGTPIASAFTTLPGRHLLELLTMMATTSLGRRGVFVASKLIQTVAKLDDNVGFEGNALDALSERVLSRVSVAKDDAFFRFFKDISKDQGAIIQLTPESMNLFNAAVIDNPQVSYSSILTSAPNPLAAFQWSDLWAPARAGARALFTIMYYLAAREHRHYPYPHPGSAVEDLLRETDPSIDAASNDGIVPTLSQVYGQILGLCQADHLDVVGQYDTGDPFSDWLPCGSDYGHEDFEQTWTWVAEAIEQGSGDAQGRRKTLPFPTQRVLDSSDDLRANLGAKKASTRPVA